MYIKDYIYEDNQISYDTLSDKHFSVSSTSLLDRLEVDKQHFAKVVGQLCDTNEYIQILEYKNSPKRFSITIKDKDNNKITIDLPINKNHQKYKITEENLVREYDMVFNQDAVSIKLDTIEFKKGKNSFKKGSGTIGENIFVKINDYIGSINFLSKEDMAKDEEKIKDLVLSLQETPSTEELYLKIKNTITNKYDAMHLLYKKAMDIESKPDEIKEKDGLITKFLVTRNNKQYDLTNESFKINTKNK